MHTISRLLILAFLGAHFAYALSPVLAPPIPPAQSWANADAIVYGQIIHLELDARNEATPPRYRATLRIERSWKGALTGDITLKGDHDPARFVHAPFFQKNYLMFLKPAPDGHRANLVYDIVLPLQTALNSGVAAWPGMPDHPVLETLEFLEGKTGNESEAARIRAMRLQPAHEREASAQKMAKFLADAEKRFTSILQEKNVALRKTLLSALKTRVENQPAEPMADLVRRIHAEFSIITTYENNGLTSFP